MLDLDEQPKAYLLQAIKSGRAFLTLGAGASKTSHNSEGTDVLVGAGLAALIAKEAGLPYNKNFLKDVLSAAVPSIISEHRLYEIIQEQYLGITPSNELTDLLGFSWLRLYTLNYDDSIEQIGRSSQKRKYFNGMTDAAHTNYGIETLPIIHLHGEAQKPEHGFILTEIDYNQQILNGTHRWYKQLAQDYAARVPIFIGSRLEEPVLALELERCRPRPGMGLGQAFLVTPDTIDDIEKASLSAKNVVYIQATLAEFVAYLKMELGRSTTPGTVAAEQSAFAASIVNTYAFKDSDASIASAIQRFSYSDIQQEIANASEAVARQAAQNFLEGAPSNWRISASGVPVWLKQTSDLYKFVCDKIAERSDIALVIGQAGSGKSTALMQCLSKYSREHGDCPIYQIKNDAISLRSTLELLDRAIPDEHAVVYISDAAPFGDSFGEDLSRLKRGRFTVFSSARTGEWKSRIKRRLPHYTAIFEFQRFSREDYQPLLDRLVEFVPAPALVRLAPLERLRLLESSRSQLLIALKETTHAAAFDNVITTEYERLSSDAQILLLICSLGSVARSGIDEGAANEAYHYAKAQVDIEDAWSELSGIVISADGRVSARHELYARHLFDNVASLSDVIQAYIAVLRTFTKVQHPIIKNVNRFDQILFKFSLSHNYIKDLCIRRGSKLDGLEIYAPFENEFRLDGHYWLQYGQYLSEIGELSDALRKLAHSIDAFPENEFAKHAFADLQLKVALRREKFDTETKRLIGSAVSALRKQDEERGLTADFYPIVTLSFGHVGALAKHGQDRIARDVAGDYLARLDRYLREDDSALLTEARLKLLSYMTAGKF